MSYTVVSTVLGYIEFCVSKRAHLESVRVNESLYKELYFHIILIKM